MTSARKVDDQIRRNGVSLGIVSIALIGLLDYYTGLHLRLGVLYAGPVLLLTRARGRWGGILAALAIVVLSLGIELARAREGLGAIPLTFLNSALRGAMLVLVAVLFGRLQEFNTRLAQQVREQTAALEADFTEHKETEKQSRERESLLSTTLSSTVDGILVVDNDGKTILTNQRFADLWAIPPDILATGSDQAMLEYVLNELIDPDAFLDKVKSLYGSNAVGMDTLHFKDGKVFERYSVPLVSGGSHIGRVWSFRDVTERRNAERALTMRNERLRMLFDRAVDGILIVSPNGKILSVSTSFAQVHGYLPEEMLSLTLKDLNTPESYRTAPDTMQRVLSGESVTFEVEHYHRDGHVILLEVSASLVLVDNEPLVQAFHRDITERRRTEVAMQALLQEKEALLKEVHHRVKNNLQVVTSMLRLESARSQLPETRTVLGEMQGRVRSMALLHEALHRSGTFAAVDLGSYLQRVATEAFHALACSPGTVRLRLELTPVPVVMDQAMPCGLLVNELLANALEHGFPDGHSGEVLIELQPAAEDGHWELRVSDTGVGLPADFDARRSQSLGLQLVTDLAGQLGGTLAIGPAPAAAFTVTFPVHHKHPLPLDAV